MKVVDRIALIGLESVGNVVLIEKHLQAYTSWKKSKSKALLHLDAHMDFGYRPLRSIDNIWEAKTTKEIHELLDENSIWDFSKPQAPGLCIYQILKEGLIKEFFWIVPDKEWANNKQLKRFKKSLSYIPIDKKIYIENKQIIAEFESLKIVTCRLEDLPLFKESVVLDIDLDFLLIPSIFKTQSFLPRIPWIRPKEVLNILRQKKIKTDLVTIAYSVEDGYVPHNYKYLGDELASLLKNPV